MGIAMTPVTTELVASATSGTLTLIAVMTFVVLLIQKEIAGGLVSSRAWRLSKALNVVLVPLCLVFMSVAVLRVMDVLG